MPTKIDRTRYIGISVILCSATVGADWRERAGRVVTSGFRAHAPIEVDVRAFLKRRNAVYRRVIADVCGIEATQKMVGQMAINFRPIFTTGGSADHPLDNAAMDELFESVLQMAGMNPTELFTAESAERFSFEASRAVRYARTHLRLVLNALQKEGCQFKLAELKQGDRLYAKLRPVIPEANTLKDEVRAMAYSVTHAYNAGIEAVFFTSVDAFLPKTVRNKVSNVVSQVLGAKSDECPQIAHLSESYF